MSETVVVALGGNAILTSKSRGTVEEQFEKISRACKLLVKIVIAGYRVAITHGNGPQVGDILLRNEIAKDILPQMPLDICGAESQGMIGYMLQQALHNELRETGLTDKHVITVLTQTLTSIEDQAFRNPSKPIGPSYSKAQAGCLKNSLGWVLISDAGKGYRRVVSSPKPLDIIEAPSIKRLVDLGIIVIAAGGGGAPVIKDNNNIRGVEAVIDKDRSAAMLAKMIRAEILLILTDVDCVSLNYGNIDQKNLASLSIEEAKKYLKEGQFPEGNMGPKIESAIDFIEGGGRKTIIASIMNGFEALKGRSGTVIMK